MAWLVSQVAQHLRAIFSTPEWLNDHAHMKIKALSLLDHAIQNRDGSVANDRGHKTSAGACCFTIIVCKPVVQWDDATSCLHHDHSSLCSPVQASDSWQDGNEPSSLTVLAKRAHLTLDASTLPPAKPKEAPLVPCDTSLDCELLLQNSCGKLLHLTLSMLKLVPPNLIC